MTAVLEAAGMTCTRPRDAEQWAAVLATTGPLVVLVAGAAADDLTPLLSDAAAQPPAMVHVLPTVTVELVSSALFAGATSVVAAEAEPGHVVDVVRAAARGQTLLLRATARAMCRPSLPAAPELTAGESLRLHGLAEGATVAALARAANCSEREMYRLLSALYARLGAVGRTQALLRAQRCGLLDSPPT